MRAVLYGLSAAAMAVAGLAMAMLVWLAPNLLFFFIGGAMLSGIIAGAWVAVGATAGAWPRPRTGQVLIPAGSLGLLLGLWRGDWLAAGWAFLVLLTGVGFAVRIFPERRAKSARPGAVKAPLGRREEL